jgi:sterol desaturase/sphingolipid hydroxylase (fatty acid hydroxylase superfamily)
MLENTHPLMMFVQGFLSQAVAYFAVVGFIFLLVRKWGAQRFRGAKIHIEDRVNATQIKREIKNTIVVLLVSMPMIVVISMLYASGHTKLTNDVRTIGWPLVILTFAGLLLLNDFWFYSWHRLLHHPKLFRHIHSVHHKSVDVNPFSSYSFHWFEGLVLGAWILPVVLLVPIYLPVLGALQALGLVNNVMSHLGYEFLPRWLLSVPGLRWINTATFHSLHHTSPRGNYGLMFRLWDRLLGTEIPHYEQAFLNRGSVSK